ncbi:MAG: hypothetical protein M1839_009175 [Geoglossum umbratile]|nr:MAG: hypothetical protein M1839_009175 [Geoglossum umbratile]
MQAVQPHEGYDQSPFRRGPAQDFGGRSASRGDVGPEAQRIISTQQTAGEEMVPSVPAAPQRTSRNHRVLSPSSNGTSGDSSPSASPASCSISATPPLTPLQIQGPLDEGDLLEPVVADESGSFDLLAPPKGGGLGAFSLENRVDLLFSTKHLEAIFSEPGGFSKFVEFLDSYRPRSVPVLSYFLNAKKALKAISYSNAIASETLRSIEGCQFSFTYARPTANSDLEEKVACAFEKMVKEDLPAYITHVYIQNASITITRRITGTLAPYLRKASEGLAEVFCLTDPSRPDNPIVFASEEFHRTTQYGIDYVLGRNCRRRDGSPFVNLLMCAPLCDSRGKVRYFIGAQIDVSGLVKECTGLESLQRLASRETLRGGGRGDDLYDYGGSGPESKKSNGFQGLCEMLDTQEQETVREWVFRKAGEECILEGDWVKHRHLLQEKPPTAPKRSEQNGFSSGKLGGPYQNYLLIRPFPSLRILFASPSLRVPGILQSPFISKIGGSKVRGELAVALEDGRGITARVIWISKAGDGGRHRWVHCTPLFGSNGQIGVWMIVIVDGDSEGNSRRWRQPPPVPPVTPTVAEQKGDTAQTFGGRTSTYVPIMFLKASLVTAEDILLPLEIDDGPIIKAVYGIAVSP